MCVYQVMVCIKLNLQIRGYMVLVLVLEGRILWQKMHVMQSIIFRVYVVFGFSTIFVFVP